MLYDASLLRNAATNALLTYFQNALILLGMVVVMLIQDAWLTLGILLVEILLGVGELLFEKVGRAYRRLLASAQVLTYEQ